MAKTDKRGNPKGKLGKLIYRNLNSETIIQSAPVRVKQTKSSQIAALEFGICSNATKIIRQIGSFLFEHTDPYLSGKLNAVMRKCLGALPQSAEDKNLNDIDPTPFVGFQFNSASSFEKNLLVMPRCTVHPDGTIELCIDDLTPKKHIPFLQCNTEPEPGSFLRIAAVAIDYKQKEYQLLVMDEIMLAKSKMDTPLLPHTHNVHWECLKQLQKDTLVFVFLSLHYYQLDWLNRKKTMGDKHQLPNGILTAFRVNETLYEQNRQVATHPEHQPMEEPVEFYMNTAATQQKIEDIKTV